MSGTFVYIDFNKINHPCNCSVYSYFNGTLLIISKDSPTWCIDEVTVKSENTTLIYKCDKNPGTSTIQSNDNDTIVHVSANRMRGYDAQQFQLCLGFGENGMIPIINLYDAFNFV